jgi:hypothetical protein
MKRESKIFFLSVMVIILLSIIWGIDQFFIKNNFKIFLTEEEIPAQSDRFFDFFNN